jgi:RNA-binding protein YlmH
MRLDIFVSQEKNISRSQALKYIREGKVLVNGEVQKKTGHSVTPADNIFIETTLNTTESVVKHDISFETKRNPYAFSIFFFMP